jgi:hypothetical protein
MDALAPVLHRYDRSSNENAAKGKYGQNIAPAYSDTIFYNQNLAANTAVLLVDPERNHNGLLLLDLNICLVGAATPFFAIMAGNHLPQSVYDGDAILGANNITATIAMGDTVNPMYIEPGKGLYVYPLVATTSGSIQAAFRIL